MDEIGSISSESIQVPGASTWERIPKTPGEVIVRKAAWLADDPEPTEVSEEGGALTYLMWGRASVVVTLDSLYEDMVGETGDPDDPLAAPVVWP